MVVLCGCCFCLGFVVQVFADAVCDGVEVVVKSVEFRDGVVDFFVDVGIVVFGFSVLRGG